MANETIASSTSPKFESMCARNSAILRLHPEASPEYMWRASCRLPALKSTQAAVTDVKVAKTPINAAILGALKCL